MSSLTELEQLIRESENPAAYFGRVLGPPYPWQLVPLDPSLRRVLMLSCRQAGKSTVVAAKTLCKAKSGRGVLSLITCPAQDQSKELMHKVDQFILHDNQLPRLLHDGTCEKEFETRSRIIALPGSERAVRSYSAPQTIIVDEAAQVPDETIFALRPMMTAADTELLVLSTPRGKRGYFWRQWAKGKYWTKILVRAPWDLNKAEDGLVPAMPEAEFHAKMLEEGVLAFYSPRHAGKEGRAFLEEELDNIGPLWFRQEYLCEFVDELTMIFTTELVQRAMRPEIEPLRFAEPVTSDVRALNFGGNGG